MAYTKEIIKALESKGFKRWTKGNLDRLYIDARELGLDCTYYKTGNISYAEFGGEKISNSWARAMKAAKTFIDVNTGKAYSSEDRLKEAAEKLAAEVIAERS